MEEQAEGKEEQEEDAINVFCCPGRFLMHEHDMDEKNDKARNIDNFRRETTSNDQFFLLSPWKLTC